MGVKIIFEIKTYKGELVADIFVKDQNLKSINCPSSLNASSIMNFY